MRYPVILEKNKNGMWTVTCPVLPGCVSEGQSRREALKNIKDAIGLYLRAVKKELVIVKRRGRQVARVSA